MYKLGILDQIALASMPVNRLAFFIGGILGAFVPIATFTLAHFEVASASLKWLLVAGGLVYSAITVVQWGKIAFGNYAKSVGFVVLIEGVAVFSSTPVIGVGALMILAMINGLSTGYRLVADRKAMRQEASALRSPRPKRKGTKSVGRTRGSGIGAPPRIVAPAVAGT